MRQHQIAGLGHFDNSFMMCRIVGERNAKDELIKYRKEDNGDTKQEPRKSATFRPLQLKLALNSIHEKYWATKI
jgi:hypothetical protein